MKIISFNIGSFVWVKYFFKSKQNYFQIENLTPVSNLISKEDPDLILLFEIWEQEHLEKIKNKFSTYKYSYILNTWYKSSSAIILSKNHIDKKSKNIFYSNGFYFVPTHLFSFSATERLNQVLNIKEEIKEILPILKNFIIIGDTNFWSFGRFIFFRNDRLAISDLLESFSLASKSILYFSKMFLNLDKVFLSNDIEKFNTKIIKHNISYMDHYALMCDINKR